MEILQDLVIEAQLNEYENTLEYLLSNVVLAEGVIDFNTTDEGQMFDEAIKRLEAAKRGLGIVNKMPMGAERKQNRSRIMGNLNRIRNLVNQLMRIPDDGEFGRQMMQSQASQSAVEV